MGRLSSLLSSSLPSSHVPLPFPHHKAQDLLSRSPLLCHRLRPPLTESQMLPPSPPLPPQWPLSRPTQPMLMRVPLLDMEPVLLHVSSRLPLDSQLDTELW